MTDNDKQRPSRMVEQRGARAAPQWFGVRAALLAALRLLKPPRLGTAPTAWSLSLLLSLACMLSAQASMTCKRIDQLPLESNAAIVDKIEALTRANHGSRSYSIHSLDGRHYFLQPKTGNCNNASCYYHLVQLQKGAPVELLTFLGAGIIWIILSPANMQFDGLDGRYSIIAVETDAKRLLNIALPLDGNALVVEPLSGEDSKILRCPLTK